MFEVWVNDGVRSIDLYPVAEDVLDKAPYPCGMDALRLAELAQMFFNNEYIHVANYPRGADTSYCKMLVIRVTKWARWIHKEKSMRQVSFDQWQIRASEVACEKMKLRDGDIIRTKDVQRIPLNDCWQDCHCWYALHRPNRHG